MWQKDSEGNQHAKGTALREEQEVRVHFRRNTHNKYAQLYTIWASFGKCVKSLHRFRKQWAWNVFLFVVCMSSLSDLLIVVWLSSAVRVSWRGWDRVFNMDDSLATVLLSLPLSPRSSPGQSLTSLCSLFSYSAEMSNRTHDQILGFPHIHMEVVLLLHPQTTCKSSVLPVVLIYTEANDHRELMQMTGWDAVCEISGVKGEHKRSQDCSLRCPTSSDTALNWSRSPESKLWGGAPHLYTPSWLPAEVLKALEKSKTLIVTVPPGSTGEQGVQKVERWWRSGGHWTDLSSHHDPGSWYLGTILDWNRL